MSFDGIHESFHLENSKGFFYCACGEVWNPRRDERHPIPERVEVYLFKPSGKFYTDEMWRIPVGAIGPHDMSDSPDFRRIGGGAVLVPSQEPWGFPHLFPGEADE